LLIVLSFFHILNKHINFTDIVQGALQNFSAELCLHNLSI